MKLTWRAPPCVIGISSSSPRPEVQSSVHALTCTKLLLHLRVWWPWRPQVQFSLTSLMKLSSKFFSMLHRRTRSQMFNSLPDDWLGLETSHCSGDTTAERASNTGIQDIELTWSSLAVPVMSIGRRFTFTAAMLTLRQRSLWMAYYQPKLSASKSMRKLASMDMMPKTPFYVTARPATMLVTSLREGTLSIEASCGRFANFSTGSIAKLYLITFIGQKLLKNGGKSVKEKALLRNVPWGHSICLSCITSTET